MREGVGVPLRGGLQERVAVGEGLGGEHDGVGEAGLTVRTRVTVRDSDVVGVEDGEGEAEGSRRRVLVRVWVVAVAVPVPVVVDEGERVTERGAVAVAEKETVRE